MARIISSTFEIASVRCEAFRTVTTRLSLRIFIAVAVISVPQAFGQKYEIGAQFSGTHLHKIDEAPLGIGLRINRNITPILATDTELTYCPQNPSGNFGEIYFLAGGRIGASVDKIGVFGKLRAGVIHFGGDFFSLRLLDKTHPMLDAGAVVEYYPTHRVILRIDLG